MSVSIKKTRWRTGRRNAPNVPPIRVGFCENGAGYGGAIISLAAMLEHLGPEFAPHLYTNLASEPYQQLQRLSAWAYMPPRVMIDPAAMRRRGIPFASHLDNLCNILPYAIRYYRKFKADKIDLVYLNNEASCNLAAALAAKFAGLPLVLHARGFHSNTRANRWVLARLDHCMPVSQAVKRQLIGLGLALERCSVVHEGLDLSSFRPIPQREELAAELGIVPGQPVITLVGGLVDWKGQDVLLDALPQVFARYPAARVLLVGASYGKKDHFSRMIAARVAAPELASRVLLTGGRDDIPDILALSSVVIHASTSPEPFGRTFLEGMAVGRPVIASNEGGPVDVIEDGVDGLLIAPRDPKILAGAILRILDDPVLAGRLGENGVRKAAGFSIEHHTETVKSILWRVINARASATANSRS